MITNIMLQHNLPHTVEKFCCNSFVSFAFKNPDAINAAFYRLWFYAATPGPHTIRQTFLTGRLCIRNHTVALVTKAYIHKEHELHNKFKGPNFPNIVLISFTFDRLLTYLPYV